MNNDILSYPLYFTELAIKKAIDLIEKENNPLINLRIYIIGGGCSGFKYGFTFDEKINSNDLIIEKNCIKIIIDPMSFQYLVGGTVDYSENLQGSRFIIINPNAKTTCGCGSSFSI